VKTHSVGRIAAGFEASWPFVLKPPRTAYTSGNRIATDTRTRIPNAKRLSRLSRRVPVSWRASARVAVSVVPVVDVAIA
jgi:hypothetical protein